MSQFNLGWIPLIQQELRKFFASKGQGDKADTALQPGAIGTTVQGYDADLAAIAALNTNTNGVVARTGAGAATIHPTGTAGLAVLAAADEAAARSAIGAMANTAPEIITNANGTAYRWPNALQICHFQLYVSSGTPTAWGSLYISPLSTFAFPAAFNAVPHVAPAFRYVSGEGLYLAWAVMQQTTTTTVNMYALSAFATGGCRLGYIAIGTYTP